MNNPKIDQILSHKNENQCITILFPTHRTSPERRKDALLFSNLIEETKNLLQLIDHTEAHNKKIVLKELDAYLKIIDFTHSEDGIGIYISPTVSELIYFPFEVEQKVQIDTTFYTRELRYFQQTQIDYAIVALSQKHVNIYLAQGPKIHLVHNDDFPLDYSEEYEYTKPSKISSYGSIVLKQYEKEKSTIEDVRRIDFFKHADKLFDKYPELNLPLIVVGEEKEVADFIALSKHAKNVIGKLHSNLNFDAIHLLGDQVWEEVQRNRRIENEAKIKNLWELIGNEMVAIGILDVWRTTKAGNCLELYVEKDFAKVGYVSKDGQTLKLVYSEQTKNFLRVNDMVEKIIELVLEKNGKVVFVANGTLKDFDGIALKLRYPDLG
jgi:hypothetical protein